MNTVEILKALAHETRLRVLHLLLEQQSLCVCDLLAILELPQSTISRHLRILRDQRLVTDYRENQWVHYEISRDLADDWLVMIEKLVVQASKEIHFIKDLARLKKTKLAVCC